MRTVLFLLVMTFIMASCSNQNEEAKSSAASTNEALECIMTRTSVRQYVPGKEISPDTIEILLKAAMAAPTAVNKQPWEFIVVTDHAIMDSLVSVCPYARMLEHAPLAIIPCGDLSKALEGDAQLMWLEDLSAATENLLLAAHAVGLGAVWTGVYPVPERVEGVKKVLGLPANIIPVAVVPVGYPDGEHQPKDKWDAGKVHYNAW